MNRFQKLQERLRAFPVIGLRSHVPTDELEWRISSY
jgi:hypothetical protein